MIRVDYTRDLLNAMLPHLNKYVPLRLVEKRGILYWDEEVCVL